MNITDRQTLWRLHLDFAMSGSGQPLLAFTGLPWRVLSFSSIPVFISSLLLSFSHGSKYDLATSSPSPTHLQWLTVLPHTETESWKRDLTAFCGHMLHKRGWVSQIHNDDGCVFSLKHSLICFPTKPQHIKQFWQVFFGEWDTIPRAFQNFPCFNKSIKYCTHWL